MKKEKKMGKRGVTEGVLEVQLTRFGYKIKDITL